VWLLIARHKSTFPHRLESSNFTGQHAPGGDNAIPPVPQELLQFNAITYRTTSHRPNGITPRFDAFHPPSGG
jgi:hypothetical protein